MLLVKQPVPISPVRTQLPGARVLLIVHSVHTSGRQGPGRLETNYVLKKSLFVPQSSTCVCRPPLLYSQVTRVRRTERGRVSEAQTLPWYDLQLLTSNTIALGLQGLRQHFSTGGERGLCTKPGNFILENEKKPRAFYIMKYKKGRGFLLLLMGHEFLNVEKHCLG